MMKYWAFISYSQRDEKWARWLHRAIEGYRVPARLVGKPTRSGVVPKRLFPVFRDRDELSTSPDLGGSIVESLTQSRFLIVICSPLLGVGLVGPGFSRRNRSG
jgi:eukaryotic-like serine/threonine-protein kinase